MMDSGGSLVKSSSAAQRRRPGVGTKKLVPIDDSAMQYGGAKPKKIFSKKDLVESVRKMAPARYANVTIPKSTSAVITRVGGDGGAVTQLRVMDDGVNLNARRFNDLKLEADRKAKELKTKLDALQSLKMENDALLDMKQKNTPESVRIEELVVEIEESNRKTEEKLHYRRQLQHMLRRLQKNQITFDAHINAMEDALRSAQREHDEVKSLVRQLEAGKTKAVLDLYEIQRQVAIERRDRARVISVRQHEANNAKKMDDWRKEREIMRQEFTSELRGDLSAEEERALEMKLKEREALAEELHAANEAKLKEFNKLEEQFTAIRQATGVNSLEEMVEKFIGQEGNRESLNNEKREVETRLANAKRKKEQVEAKFSELKASGIGSTELNREISDDLNAQIQGGRMELKVTKAACERLENVLVSLRQGSIGLFQRLESYMHLLESEQGQRTDISTMDPVEAITLSEHILSKMMESVGGGDASPSRFGQSLPGDDDSVDASANDEASSSWSALGMDDIPQARDNVRVKTVKENHSLMEMASKPDKSRHEEDEAESELSPEDSELSEMVPTRDFLKLSSSRQHAEMIRKKEADVKRQKMLERFEAADEADKEKLASLANKKKRQRDAITKLSENKEIIGVPPGVNPKLDAMSRSQAFLDHTPTLL